MIGLTYAERAELKKQALAAAKRNPTPFFPHAYLDRLTRVYTLAPNFQSLVSSDCWTVTLNTIAPRNGELEARSDANARHERRYLADAYDAVRKPLGLSLCMRY